ARQALRAEALCQERAHHRHPLGLPRLPQPLAQAVQRKGIGADLQQPRGPAQRSAHAPVRRLAVAQACWLHAPPLMLRMNSMLPEHLIERLHRCRHLLIFTGAGVSAESGIPTFRDKQSGLWARYRPEQLASPEGFRAAPQTVWDWYAWRREKCLAAEPNPAHLAIAELQRRLPRVS